MKNATITVENVSNGTGQAEGNLAMLFITMLTYCAQPGVFPGFRAFAITTALDEDENPAMPDIAGWFSRLTPAHLAMILTRTRI